MALVSGAMAAMKLRVPERMVISHSIVRVASYGLEDVSE